MTMPTFRAAVPFVAVLVAGCASARPATQGPEAAEPDRPATEGVVVRINQIGYLPDGQKVAVACAVDASTLTEFEVLHESGRSMLGPAPVAASGGFGPCTTTWRPDFSNVREPGRYHGSGRGPPVSFPSRPVRVVPRASQGPAAPLLAYLRRSAQASIRISVTRYTSWTASSLMIRSVRGSSF